MKNANGKRIFGVTNIYYRRKDCPTWLPQESVMRTSTYNDLVKEFGCLENYYNQFITGEVGITDIMHD